MDLGTILLILIVIGVIVVAFSLLKHLLKYALIAGIIVVVLSLIFGGSVLRDFSVLGERETELVVVAYQDETLTTGIIRDERISLLRPSEVAGALERNERSVMVTPEAIVDTTINNKPVSAEEIRALLSEGTDIPSLTYEDLVIDLDIRAGERDEQSAMLAYLYEEELRLGAAPLTHMRLYKDGSLLVEPRSPAYLLVKIVPLSWIDETLKKLKDGAKEQATGLVS